MFLPSHPMKYATYQTKVTVKMHFVLFSSICFSFPIALLLSSTVAAQHQGNITVDQSLSATASGSAWLSPSGDFAFGFHQLPNTANLFLLAIWYAKIPDTIVWYANEGNAVPQGSKVTVTADEGLVLSDPQGKQLWNTTDELNNGGVSYGFMNDTGNFALKSSSNELLWESFGHPTDTLLPTQRMQVGGLLNSRRSLTNFTKGRFQLHFTGDLVLTTSDLVNSPGTNNYYSSSTTSSTDSGKELFYDTSGYMYIQSMNGSKFNLTRDKGISGSDSYYRATLNFDGVLTWYNHSRVFSKTNDVAWSNTKSVPENICLSFGSDYGSGACGYNSICGLDNNQRPKCVCPDGYFLLDPDDINGSCEPNFKLVDCDEKGQGAVKGSFKMVEYQHTDWKYGDYEYYLGLNAEEDCSNSCLNDCFCAAAIFKDGTCWKKRSPLSNGQQSDSLYTNAWLKVGSGYPNPIVKNKMKTVFSVLLGGSALVNFILFSVIVLGLYFLHRKHHLKKDHIGTSENLGDYGNISRYSYRELEVVTNGFQEELGRGAFGVVYKGLIKKEGSDILVAVKKLHQIREDSARALTTEVNVIGQTYHKNLVQLIGFCEEGVHQLLVYEYMRNGTLENYLLGDPKPSWEARVHIAQGAARGLLYLHEDCNHQIIHCDIKPPNILLDDHHNARISDFGMAKLLALTQSHTYTMIRGTKGYVAPEWFRNKPITVKVDVYSFGILLLEIICLRKNVCMEIREEGQAILTDWAFDCYQCGTLDSLVNGEVEVLDDRIRFERFLMVALWCVQEEPSIRPTMRMVTLMLEGEAEVPNPPCPTSLSISTQS